MTNFIRLNLFLIHNNNVDYLLKWTAIVFSNRQFEKLYITTNTSGDPNVERECYFLRKTSL